MNNVSTVSNGKFLPHVHLENLINSKFGLFLEIQHERFVPTAKNHRKIARTTVKAYKTKDEAIAAKKNPNSVNPVAIATSECSAGDQFVRKVGLLKALHRLYRVLAAK